MGGDGAPPSSSIIARHRMSPGSRMSPTPCRRVVRSNSADQEQDQHDNQKQPESAARIIAPAPAVRPSGKCAEEQEKQYDQQNDS
jgi:hypothetical protein